MSHLKREKSPKNWPIERKGTAYLVRPRYNLENGVPILIIVRDMLKLAKDRKEVKHAMNSKQIMLNHRPVLDDKDCVQMFDVITILPAKESGHSEKSYRLVIGKNKKFNLQEVSNSQAGHKISKIINKKTLRGNKTQINFSDGRNFLSDIKCKVGDSGLVNLKAKKLDKIFPLKEGEKAMVYAGKHAGEQGKIAEIDKENNRVKLEIGNENVDILIKQIMMVE